MRDQPCYLLAVHHWASGTASLCRFFLSHVSEQWYQPHAAGQEHAWHRPEPYEGQTPALLSLEEESLAQKALGPPPRPHSHRDQLCLPCERSFPGRPHRSLAHITCVAEIYELFGQKVGQKLHDEQKVLVLLLLSCDIDSLPPQVIL